MLGHEHEGQQPHGALVERFGQHAQQGRVSGRCFQQRPARHRSVEDMVDGATRGLSRTAGHARSVFRGRSRVQKKRAASSFLSEATLTWLISCETSVFGQDLSTPSRSRTRRISSEAAMSLPFGKRICVNPTMLENSLHPSSSKTMAFSNPSRP